MPHRVQTFYAVLTIDPNGDESVPAFLDRSTNMMMPLVGSDLARVESLKNAAQNIASITGRTLTLVQFSVREDLQSFTPGSRVAVQCRCFEAGMGDGHLPQCEANRSC